MTGFTLQWDPHGDVLVARKEPDTGLLDGRVCAAWIAYAREMVEEDGWNTTGIETAWCWLALAAELGHILDQGKVRFRARF